MYYLGRVKINKDVYLHFGCSTLRTKKHDGIQGFWLYSLDKNARTIKRLWAKGDKVTLPILKPHEVDPKVLRAVIDPSTVLRKVQSLYFTKVFNKMLKELK